MLYPAELRAEYLSVPSLSTVLAARGFGRGERIRTSDILLPKQALYQAELRPGPQDCSRFRSYR